MDIREHFLLSISPERETCLGLTLRPYSLGHSILLQRHGNGFLKGDGNYSDLISGVLICSLSWEEFHKFQHSPFLGMFLKLWGFLSRRFNVLKEAQKFKSYIELGSYWPDVSVSGRGKKMVCPWENRLKITLMREFKLTESEVLNQPLAKSHIDFCTLGEMNGSFEMVSAEHDAVMEYHRNRVAKENAENGLNKN